MYKIEIFDQEGILYKLEINEKIAPASFFGSHRRTKALVSLIEKADLSNWEKHPDDELQPYDFYTAIVGAVATSLKEKLPEGASLRDTMIDIVDDALVKDLLDDPFEGDDY